MEISQSVYLSVNCTPFMCVCVCVCLPLATSLFTSHSLSVTHTLSLSLLEGIEVRKKIVDLHFSKEFLSQSSSEDALAHYWVPRRSLLSEGAEEMVHLRDLPMLLPIDCQF